MQSEIFNDHQQVVGPVRMEFETTTHGVDATVESEQNSNVIASNKVLASMEYGDIVKAHTDDKMVMSSGNEPRVKAETSHGAETSFGGKTSPGATISKKYQRLSEEERAFIWYHKDHASTPDIQKMYQACFEDSAPSEDQIRYLKKKPEDDDLSAAAIRYGWYKPETPKIHSLADCSAEQKAFLAYNVKRSLNKLLKAFRAVFHQKSESSTMSLLIKAIKKDPDFTNLASAAEGYDWCGAFDLTVKPRGGHTTDGITNHKPGNAERKPMFTDEQRAYIGYWVGFEMSVTKITDSFYERFGGGWYYDYDIKREIRAMKRKRTRRLHYLNIAESRREWDWYQGPKQPGDPYFLMQERLTRQDEVCILCYLIGICS